MAALPASCTLIIDCFLGALLFGPVIIISIIYAACLTLTECCGALGACCSAPTEVSLVAAPLHRPPRVHAPAVGILTEVSF